MKTIAKRLWESSTFMTWGSFALKSLNLVIILPIILSKFSEQEVVVWLLFLSVISLVYICDFGFSPSFSRIIAYAMGGSTLEHVFKSNSTGGQTEINWNLINRIYYSMSKVYWIISLITTVLIATIGTYLVSRPIGLVKDAGQLWSSWIVILISVPFIINGIKYSTYLIGSNQIAFVKRLDMLFTTASILCSLVIVTFYPSILLIIVNNQFWLLVNAFRDYLIVRNEKNLDIRFVDNNNKEIFDIVWKSSWKTAIGMLASFGVMQFTGIFFAQYGKSAEVASYMLSLKIMNSIIDFTRAPFYTKLPILSSLLAKGENDKLISIAKKGMGLTMCLYTLAVMSVGIFHDIILKLIGSKVSFVSMPVWILMSWAFFFERYGALNIQLFSITNKIIWHICNGIVGIVTISLMFLLHNVMGIFVFPFSMFVAYFSFYSWFPAYNSYKIFHMNFLSFEKLILILPAIFLLIYTVIYILVL